MPLTRGGFHYIQNRLSSPDWIYLNYIRPLFPIAEWTLVLNGVETRPFRTSDRYFPGFLKPNQGAHPDPESYEIALCDSIRDSVFPGDSVTIIGGGLGVTAVIAANESENGQVTVFEAAKSMVPHIKSTLALNGVSDCVDTRHAIVGHVASSLSPPRGAETIPPGELDECDVLEMDCEGAEVQILRELDIRPRTLIVETHGTRDDVRRLLSDMGYEVKYENVAEEGALHAQCVRSGIYVLTAHRES